MPTVEDKLCLSAVEDFDPRRNLSRLRAERIDSRLAVEGPEVAISRSSLGYRSPVESERAGQPSTPRPTFRGEIQSGPVECSSKDVFVISQSYSGSNLDPCASFWEECVSFARSGISGSDRGVTGGIEVGVLSRTLNAKGYRTDSVPLCRKDTLRS